MALLKAVSQASWVHFRRASLGATNKPVAKSIFFPTSVSNQIHPRPD